MTRISRRTMIKEINRDAIINATEMLLEKSENGIHGFTMDDIAKCSDFTKRTIYQYFASKDEILFSIMIRGYEKMLHSMRQVDLIQGNGLKKINDLANILVQFSQEDPLHFWLIMSYENKENDFKVNEELLKETYRLGEELLGLLIKQIIIGKQDGSMNPNLEEKTTALSLWSFLLGLLTTLKTKKNYLIYVHHIDIDKWLEESLGLIYQTLT